MSRTPPTSERTGAGTDASAVAAEVKALLDAGDRDGGGGAVRGCSWACGSGGPCGWRCHYLRERRRRRRRRPGRVREAVRAHDQLPGRTCRSTRGSHASWSNACLDRAKARSRARRWLLRRPATRPAPWRRSSTVAAAGPSPERRLLVAAKWRELSAAVRELPARQRDVFMLCHLDEQTPAEVAAAPGHEPGHGARPPVPRPAQAAHGAGRPAMRRPLDAHLDDDHAAHAGARCRRRADARRRGAPGRVRALPGPRRRPRRARSTTSVPTPRAPTDATFSAADLGPPAARDPRPHRPRPPRSARVLRFPGHDPGPLAARPDRRWLAVAAAAGLVLGVLAGQLPHLRRLAAAPTGPTRRDAPSPAASAGARASWPLEDTLLSEVEAALDADAAVPSCAPSTR